MKRELQLRLWVPGALCFLILSACTDPGSIELDRAQQAVSVSNFKEALDYFDRVIKRDPQSEFALKAAREGARIALYEVKDYAKAIDYYRELVLNSTNSEERLASQKMIASIYLDNLSQHDKAIIEYHRLLELPHSPAEDIEYRVKIARSYYYANNFPQTMIEVEALLKKDLQEDLLFDLLLLKANTYMAKRELDKGAEVLINLMKRFPERSVKESVALTLAVSYEEQKDYKKAIGILEEAKASYPRPEYLEVRIRRLKDRALNAPGAKGMRK